MFSICKPEDEESRSNNKNNKKKDEDLVDLWINYTSQDRVYIYIYDQKRLDI